MSYETASDSEIPTENWSGETEIDRSSNDEATLPIGTALSVLWFVEGEPDERAISSSS